jgi:hypothetical protein
MMGHRRFTQAVRFTAFAAGFALAGCQSGGTGSGGTGSGSTGSGTASGSGGGGVAEAQPGVPLSITQIEALLVGSTLEGTTADGRSLCVFHSTETRTSNSMIVRGTQSGGPFHGFYRVEPPSGNADPATDPGVVCYSYPDAGVFADCRSVRQSGAVGGGGIAVALYDRDGALAATGTVRPGDSCGVAQ